MKKQLPMTIAIISPAKKAVKTRIELSKTQLIPNGIIATKEIFIWIRKKKFYVQMRLKIEAQCKTIKAECLKKDTQMLLGLFLAD